MNVFNGIRKVHNITCYEHRKSLIETSGKRLSSITLNDIISSNPWMKKIPINLLYDEKNKVDNQFSKIQYKLRNRFFDNTSCYPKYYSYKATVPMSYVDNLKNFVVSFSIGKNSNNHQTISLPHLRDVEILKSPINNISKFLQVRGLVYGITFKYVSTKIMVNQNNKFYASILYCYDDETLFEYKDFTLKNITLPMKYTKETITDRVVGVQLKLSMNKNTLCADSYGKKFYITNRIKRLIKFMIKHKNSNKKLMFCKTEQLRNAVKQLTIDITNYLISNYDIIVVPDYHLSTKHNVYKEIIDTFTTTMFNIITYMNEKSIETIMMYNNNNHDIAKIIKGEFIKNWGCLI